MSKLFLITGGCGFVGRHLIQILSAKGYLVRTIVRGKSKTSHLKGKNITIIESIDMFSEDEDWWRDNLKGVDFLIHAAWYVNPSDYLTSGKNIDCLIGTLNIAKIAAESSVKKFVGIGTCFEYKKSSNNLSVTSPLEPETLYAATKVAAYNILLQIFKASETQFLWCRLFYLHGEGEKKQRLVPYIISHLAENKIVELNSAEQIKDYMDVTDAAKEIIGATIGNRIGAINICSGVGISIYELAISVASKVGKSHLIKGCMDSKNNGDQTRIVGVKNLD